LYCAVSRSLRAIAQKSAILLARRMFMPTFGLPVTREDELHFAVALGLFLATVLAVYLWRAVDSYYKSALTAIGELNPRGL
jgi:hypothetical protein